MPEPTQPSNFPDWATNGGATQVQPGAGQVQTGWTAQKPPFQIFNWLLALMGSWVRFISAKINLTPGNVSDTALTIDSNHNITPTQGNHFINGTVNVEGVLTTNLSAGRMFVLYFPTGGVRILNNFATAGGAAPFILNGVNGLSSTSAYKSPVGGRMCFVYDGTNCVEVWRSPQPLSFWNLPGVLPDTTLTVAAGVITPTQGSHKVEVSSGTTDIVNSIGLLVGDTGGVSDISGMVLFSTLTAGHTITFHPDGVNLISADGADIVLDAVTKFVMFKQHWSGSAAVWIEVFRSKGV